MPHKSGVMVLYAVHKMWTRAFGESRDLMEPRSGMRISRGSNTKLIVELRCFLNLFFFFWRSSEGGKWGFFPNSNTDDHSCIWSVFSLVGEAPRPTVYCTAILCAIVDCG